MNAPVVPRPCPSAMLFVTESALNVSARLAEGPAVVRYGFWAAIAALLAGFCWLAFRLLWPRRPATNLADSSPLDEQQLRQRLSDAQAAGVDAREAEEELRRLDQMRSGGELSVALLGEMSSGKSSLVRALIPDADTEVSVVGGSTREVTRYRWRAPSGDDITIVDLPGTGSDADQVALEEAQRSHILLFVCEGDLTRGEYQALGEFLSLQKPTIVVINKSDRHSEDDLYAIRDRLEKRLQGLSSASPTVVSVVAGGDEQVIVGEQSGEQKMALRQRTPVLWELTDALQILLAQDESLVEGLRDRSVFSLAHQKLLAAEQRYRNREAEALIKSYTRKAVVGALAALSPGTDILIQGYLGTAMVRSLCRLYGITPRDLDIEEFLSLSQGKLGRAIPVILAVAGNGLKAFPGAGTVAGGVVHAVAYGLIFDALGHSLHATLGQLGRLEPKAAATKFKENLEVDLESEVVEMARMALGGKKQIDDSEQPRP